MVEQCTEGRPKEGDEKAGRRPAVAAGFVLFCILGHAAPSNKSSFLLYSTTKPVSDFRTARFYLYVSFPSNKNIISGRGWRS